MRIRLMGTGDECGAAVDALRAAPGLTILEVSTAYPNRGSSDQVRVYVEARTGSVPSFTCPVCGRVSHHPRDVDEGYCGACHDWTGPLRTSIQHPLVAESRQTCFAAPEQYEGRLVDGRCFYFRMRSGRAQLGLGPTVDAAAASTLGDDPVEMLVDAASGGCFDNRQQRDTVFSKLLDRWPGHPAAGDG
ncbi:hypothetical protein ACGFI9_21840 [Micromonospora sp. NPDC048930]|uniref:hypothetical protein n=1 Tax=Micromonospora sp. NPDC048930 TaxID=3364261 RepID=UPI003718B56F